MTNRDVAVATFEALVLLAQCAPYVTPIMADQIEDSLEAFAEAGVIWTRKDGVFHVTGRVSCRGSVCSECGEEK